MADESPANDAEAPRIQFLENELDLCKTFLDVAAVEIDDPAAAHAAVAKAREGFDVALTWISSIRNETERDRLMNKLFDLRKRLDDFDVPENTEHE